MNITVNTNNKRPVPCDENWSSLSDDAQRRWRANRTAWRKFRQSSSHLTQRQSVAPGPFPPTAQPSGHHADVTPALGSPVPGAEGDAATPNMVPPVAPIASPVPGMGSFSHSPNLQPDGLLHPPELPGQLGIPPPQAHDRVTPTFHIARSSEDINDQGGLKIHLPPTSYPGDEIARNNSIEMEKPEFEGARPERDISSGPQAGISSPTPNALGVDASSHHRAAQTEDMHYALSPLPSGLSLSHSVSSGGSVADLASNSTYPTSPNESPAGAIKSPGLPVTSPAPNPTSPDVGGLDITMKTHALYRTDLAETALHKAAACGRESMTQLLLEGGADTELANAMGRRPLHLAAENGHLQVVTVLVEAGAHVEAADYAGSRPLHLAAMRGHEDVARFLLWKGAQVNAIDRPGPQ